MSVQAISEWSGWRTKRVDRLPRYAALYALSVGIGALAAATAATASSAAPTRTEWIAFALLLPLTAVAPRFRVAFGRNHAFQTGPTFLVAGALVLPPTLLLGLVVVLHLPLWSRNSLPWYIEAFNLSNHTLSALGAWAVAAAVGTGGDALFAAAGLLAAVVFVGVNHVLLALMLRLARGHSFRESGLFAATGLGIEIVLAGLGVAVGAFAVFNPWLLPALIAPLALAHRSLSTVSLLTESEERFRTMFESAPSAIMLFDLEGRIFATNRSAESMYGYTEEEMVGRLPTSFRHPDDREQGDRVFGQLVRGEIDAYRREARFVTKSGGTLVAHLATALVRKADGQPGYVIGMAEDVTGQKQLEDQLRQSQKLEAIGRLAGGVAHDFNNMLTAIGGYTVFALEHADDGTPLRADLEEIRKATDRATLLTRQLLAFSRKQVLQPELLNLNGIVLELESMLRPLIGEDIVLRTQLDPALGPIEADPGQLHQVVMNLVVNARDAMPNGGDITIETANADVTEAGDDAIEPGRYVTLTVRDAGEGIDEPTLGQIFEPFFTTKESDKGTGLGLATVYGIVKQSGGYVAVESELGVGSAFVIYLRRAADSRARSGSAEAAPDRSRPMNGDSPQAERSATVLVVEDEEVVRGLVLQVLSGEGYAVLTAADGDEAFPLAEQNRFDLLLTDLTLPGIGGRALAERLRETQPGLKVVYMSGFAETGLFDGGLPAGTAFLEKPFTFSALKDTVRALLVQ